MKKAVHRTAFFVKGSERFEPFRRSSRVGTAFFRFMMGNGGVFLEPEGFGAVRKRVLYRWKMLWEGREGGRDRLIVFSCYHRTFAHLFLTGQPLYLV